MPMSRICIGVRLDKLVGSAYPVLARAAFAAAIAEKPAGRFMPQPHARGAAAPEGRLVRFGPPRLDSGGSGSAARSGGRMAVDTQCAEVAISDMAANLHGPVCPTDTASLPSGLSMRRYLSCRLSWMAARPLR
jgi:hypothetical protein